MLKQAFINANNRRIAKVREWLLFGCPVQSYYWTDSGELVITVCQHTVTIPQAKSAATMTWLRRKGLIHDSE
jgi:hypothetical protein